MKMNSGTVRFATFNDLESVGGLYTENDFRRRRGPPSFATWPILRWRTHDDARLAAAR